jgi:hypothetical protein
MTLHLAASSDDRACAIRDRVMPLLRATGHLLSQRDVVRMIELRRDLWVFRHWTPFNDLASDEAASPGYRHAVERQHTRPGLPYGLDVCRGIRLLRILWSESGTVEVATFVRGDWEDEVLQL